MAVSRLQRRLKQARLAQGLSLRAVAKLSQGRLSHPLICEVENGHILEPTPPKLRAMAEILRLDYIELLHLAGYLTRAEKESLT